MVQISSIFVAFLENMNFNSPENSVLGQTSISSKGTNFTSDFLHTIFVNGFKSGIKVIVDFDWTSNKISPWSLIWKIQIKQNLH